MLVDGPRHTLFGRQWGPTRHERLIPAELNLIFTPRLSHTRRTSRTNSADIILVRLYVGTVRLRVGSPGVVDRYVYEPVPIMPW